MPPAAPAILSSAAQRLLPVLQLTRMALVFTAISNAQCTLLLRAQHITQRTGLPIETYFGRRQMLAVALISIGLYGFGMALNDIIDRRRDRQFAAFRPLPSGRLGLTSAYVICTLLGLLAGGSAWWYAAITPAGDLSFLLLCGTALLIAFYDMAGKYLVGLGLLTLGLIRFFHALIPAPQVPLLWHPLVLLNHVTLVSTIAYLWEEKRPALTRTHLLLVIGGLIVLDGMIFGAFAVKSQHRVGEALWLTPNLAWPAAAGVVFIGLAVWIRRRSATSRSAGQTVMLLGLLWLIVYDSLFVAGYVGLLQAAFILALLPITWLGVLLMRWWSKLMLLSQKPEYERAES